MASTEPPESTNRRRVEVTGNRHILTATRYLLWGRAAGRCEFGGCNQALWKSPVTQEQVNLGQAAHIWSFSADGPRGNAGIRKARLNDCSNLMLVCQACHKLIDEDASGERYSVPILQRMKEEHERRIEIATSIAPVRSSQVIHFGGNVGAQSSPLRWEMTAQALFPDRYPTTSKAIDLGLANSAVRDHDATFWPMEANNLVRLFGARIRERLQDRDLGHMSVFAFAPQPLLVLLGALLSDIPEVDVFQLHREPQQSWAWPAEDRPPQLPSLQEPTDTSGTPALVLSISGTIMPDRIFGSLTGPVSIWEVSVPAPNNDVIKTRAQLGAFRSLLRYALDRIKAAHGQDTRLHIFPAAPLSVAVELGRVRSPKAEMPWRLYDQNNAQGGFAHALDFPEALPK